MTSTTKDYVKKILLADAMFAAASGIIGVAAAGPLSQLMGLSDPIYLTVIGVAVALYSLDLAFVALKAADKSLFLKLFFAGDLAWILGSIVLLAGFSDLFSMIGMILIVVAALVVAGFAISKYKGLRMQHSGSFQTA